MGLLQRLAVPALLLGPFWYGANAEVTFAEKKDYLYNVAPKLRIRGEGFSTITDPKSLTLAFLPKRNVGKHYTVDVQGDTSLVLTLTSGSTWMQLQEGSSPQPLYLTDAKIGEVSILPEPLQVATVLPTPSVKSSSRPIYMTTTPKLVVNGTNFNVKQTDLLFDPPLVEGIDINKQIISSTQIIITKIHSDDANRWTPEPGPLKLVTVNTGGGRLPLSPELGGITIAEVQADLEGSGITVRNHEELDIYQSTPILKIQGEGFLPDIKVRFGNSLRGGGTNYTITSVLSSELTLELVEGSTWRQVVLVSDGNVKSLPGPLVLLAAKNTAAEWVPLGPTAAKSGRKVATVFEDPSVNPSEEVLWRTHSHELFMAGTGFNKVFQPIFVFDPPMPTGTYFTEVISNTQVKLTLATHWMPEGQTGPINVVALDTGAGMVNLPAPVKVAEVEEDTATHASGVTVYPSNGQALYQSTSKSLVISGAGFKGTPVIEFEPSVPANHYSLTVKSEDTLELELKEGKQWLSIGGPLLIKSIDVGEGVVPLAEPKGIKVAMILNQPSIKQADMSIYRTHTKHFPVMGSGFLSLFDRSKPPAIELDNVKPSAYTIQDMWSDNQLTLKLVGDQWLDVAEGDVVTIKVISINTGAGDIILPGGVPIAKVQEDSSTALCEDSCTYAEDGVCDEPLLGSMYAYTTSSSSAWLRHGWGMDDDANYYQSTDYSSLYRYAGYTRTYLYGSGYGDDDMYAGAAPCEIGTDCTDCNVQVAPEGMCTNVCRHARDDTCDDPRLGGICPSGTDCQDCGPWGDAGTNFTYFPQYSSGTWYNDDDFEFLVDDDEIALGQEANEKPIYQRTWEDHTVTHKESPGAGSVFVDVLWAMVVLIGGSVSLGVCMVAYRHFKSGGGTPMYLPVEHAAQQQDEVELAARTSATTPDVVRIG